ncbi:MAG: alpha/beta-type small acid-soluble spore protein [Clostridia bacterium]|nr:alpha/beta-type small acid-soluble spore protein [Clostridia bacterium]
MSNSDRTSKVVPEAKDSLDKFKYEVAAEVGVDLKNGYNGNMSSKDAGKIGGNMVRKMIEQAENSMLNK